MNKTISTASLVFFFGLAGLSAQQSVMDNEGIYLVCEKMPELVGGMNSVQRKIRYPLQAKSLGVQGVVYVQCVIDEKGKVVARCSGCARHLLSAEPGRDRKSVV